MSDAVIGLEVRTSFLASDRTYGARRVWHNVGSAGHNCGLHRIERLMRVQALRARPRRRARPMDTGKRAIGAPAPNILDRQFIASSTNQKWVADFTFLWTTEGWLFVAVVVDLFSRRVIGWSMQSTMTAQLVTDTLTMAVWRRGGERMAEESALLHHSDRGSQYSSESFQRLLDALGVTCSMSRSENVWYNSVMESFFSSHNTERTERKVVRVTPMQPAPMHLITSSASTTQSGGTQRWAI